MKSIYGWIFIHKTTEFALVNYIDQKGSYKERNNNDPHIMEDATLGLYKMDFCFAVPQKMLLRSANLYLVY